MRISDWSSDVCSSDLDIVPTHHALTHVTLGWGLESYHWFFMAQKEPFPEKLPCADLDYYIDYKLNKKGVGLSLFDPRAMAEYKRCTTPEQIPEIGRASYRERVCP